MQGYDNTNGDKNMVKAENILTPKVEAHGFIDLVAIGAVKQIEERLTSPYIGNGTIMSGLIKGVAGGVLDGKGGKLGKYVSGAFAVDAGEDIAMALMGMVPGIGGLTGGAAASADNW